MCDGDERQNNQTKQKKNHKTARMTTSGSKTVREADELTDQELEAMIKAEDLTDKTKLKAFLAGIFKEIQQLQAGAEKKEKEVAASAEGGKKKKKEEEGGELYASSSSGEEEEEEKEEKKKREKGPASRTMSTYETRSESAEDRKARMRAVEAAAKYYTTPRVVEPKKAPAPKTAEEEAAAAEKKKAAAKKRAKAPLKTSKPAAAPKVKEGEEGEEGDAL